MKTVQPAMKTSRKWKVIEATDQDKECPKIKEVIRQTQTNCKGLASSVTKWWSKSDGKEKKKWSSMRFDPMKIPEESSICNRDSGLIGIMLGRNPSHGMTCGT